MSTIELKELLINKIKSTGNNQLLEDIVRLFKLENTEEGPYILNEFQIDAVNESKEQIKKGQSLSNEEVNIDIEKWLGK